MIKAGVTYRTTRTIEGAQVDFWIEKLKPSGNYFLHMRSVNKANKRLWWGQHLFHSLAGVRANIGQLEVFKGAKRKNV